VNSSTGHSSLECTAGGCSYARSTAWKLVPPKPNALTPAIRSAASAAQGRAAAWKKKGELSCFQAALGFSMCSVGGLIPWCRARVVLMSPARPAAHLVCPIWDFTEPMAQLPGAAPASVNTSVSVASSVRSPTTVPVPCASMRPICAGDTPALRKARVRAARWPSGRGAVSPRARPSLALPTPSMTA
jgi:hypothetical protein